MELKSLCKNADKGNSFVGISYSDSKPSIFFPMSYNIPETNQECQKSIFSLFRTIYISNKYNLSSNYLYDSQDLRNQLPIYSYLWMLNDYLNNGLYSNKDTEYKVNGSGKINWKKTIRSEPYFNDNQAIFLKTITQRQIDKNDIITKIHIKCLNIAYQTIGFIYGNINIPIDDFNYANDYLLSILIKEQYKTFVDRKKHLISEMINILKESSSEMGHNKIKSFGTYNFEAVWEVIISKLFGNEPEISKFYPSSFYIFEESTGYQRMQNSKLRPDTVLNFNDKHFILDAKYYSFELYNNLPNSSDIQKQITYSDFMNTILSDGVDIYNAFVLPYNSKTSKLGPKEIRYIGYGETEWRNMTNKTHDKVSLILLDVHFALEAFSKHQTKLKLDLLTDEIKKSTNH